MSLRDMHEEMQMVEMPKTRRGEKQLIELASNNTSLFTKYAAV